MTPLTIGWLTFALVFGAAILGLFIGDALPEHHLSPESRDVVRLGTALIATMAALVLSLLISSAKTTFDRMDGEIVENAARAVSLDRTLADYGPETTKIRDRLKRSYASRIELLFPADEAGPEREDTPDAVIRTESIEASLWNLEPQSEAQRGLRAHAVEISAEVASTRWLLLLQKDESIPVPLLIVLVTWLAIIFATFGLFAPRNATVIGALFVCALSVSGAIFVILEMNTPLSGLMKLSSAPMRDALANLGR